MGEKCERVRKYIKFSCYKPVKFLYVYKYIYIYNLNKLEYLINFLCMHNFIKFKSMHFEFIQVHACCVGGWEDSFSSKLTSWYKAVNLHILKAFQAGNEHTMNYFLNPYTHTHTHTFFPFVNSKWNERSCTFEFKCES